MKKIYILFLTFMISVTGLFANDIQIGIGGPTLNFYDSFYANIIVQNHNYFGKKHVFGIAESVTISPFTADIGFMTPNIATSVFVGPSLCLPFGKNGNFQASAGFRYFFNWYRITEKGKYGYPEDDLLTVIDDHMFQGYSLAADLQLKFNTIADSSIVIGLPFAIGKCKRDFIRTPKSKNPETHYNSLKSDYYLESFMDLESPYILYSFNF